MNEQEILFNRSNPKAMQLYSFYVHERPWQETCNHIFGEMHYILADIEMKGWKPETYGKGRYVWYAKCTICGAVLCYIQDLAICGMITRHIDDIRQTVLVEPDYCKNCKGCEPEPKFEDYCPYPNGDNTDCAKCTTKCPQIEKFCSNVYWNGFFKFSNEKKDYCGGYSVSWKYLQQEIKNLLYWDREPDTTIRDRWNTDVCPMVPVMKDKKKSKYGEGIEVCREVCTREDCMFCGAAP